jgi:hypothetical protein
MIIGHYAVAFAAKKLTPKLSLGTLLAAAIWLDLIWPVFVLLGLEHFEVVPGITKFSPFSFTDYPLSHSLVMALAWAALWGLFYLYQDGKSKAAWVLGGLVASHWVLDFIVHRPDLPILPGQDPWGAVHAYGLGLWNYPVVTVVLEAALFIAGFWLYLRFTKAKDNIGNFGLWALALFMVVFYVASFAGGPPPNNPKLLASGAQAQWLVVLAGWWVDSHRKSA